jgi:mono/diheme cytochrome c family protein
MAASAKLRKILFASVLLVIVLAIVYAVTHQSREWIVPDEAKQRRNPLTASDSNIRAARDIYFEHCSNCHGQTGKGDGPEAHLHDPAPIDFSDPVRMKPLSDGELFYKISDGHRPMPSFKRKLSEHQRWQLVMFLRSFSTNQKP